MANGYPLSLLGAANAGSGASASEEVEVSGAVPEGSITLDEALAGNIARVDLYISPSTGNNANAGTLAAPIASIAEAVRRLKLYQRIGTEPIVWHLDHGPHAWVPVPPMLGGILCVMADPTFDPTVRTTVITGSAAAGTGASAVVTTGLTTDAQIKRWVTFTSGAAAGQVRSIRDNTTTTITPLNRFSPAPAPGDTFVIFENNCPITFADSIFMLGFVGLIPTVFGALNGNGAGVVLIGLDIRTINVTLMAPYIEMYGCSFLTGGASICFIVDSCAVMVGMASAATLTEKIFPGQSARYQGYGNSSSGLGVLGVQSARSSVVSVEINGFGSQDVCTARGISGTLYGIRCSQLIIAEGSAIRLSFLFAVTNLIRFASTRPVVRVIGNLLRLGSCTIEDPADTTGPLIRVENTGIIGGSIPSATSGGIETSCVCAATAPALTVQAVRGGKICLAGAPTVGRATPATDWDIEDGAPFDKAYFTATGVRKFFQGSLIVRVS